MIPEKILKIAPPKNVISSGQVASFPENYHER